MKKLLAATVVLAVAAGLFTPASATVYTSQAAFEAANPGLAHVTFDGIVAPDVQSAVGSPYTIAGVTFTGSSPLLVSRTLWPSSFDDLIDNAFGGYLTSTFASSNAVGLLVSQGYAGTLAPLFISVYNEATLVFSGSPIEAGVDTFSFFGIDSVGPITSVTIHPTGETQFPGLALVEFGGTAVPEPASMALISAGLLGLGLIRRRRA